MYRKIKNNNLYHYQIFQDEKNGISDTLLLFAQGESMQINQKLVEIFYCQLAYFLSKNNPRFKLELAKGVIFEFLLFFKMKVKGPGQNFL